MLPHCESVAAVHLTETNVVCRPIVEALARALNISWDVILVIVNSDSTKRVDFIALSVTCSV